MLVTCITDVFLLCSAGARTHQSIRFDLAVRWACILRSVLQELLVRLRLWRAMPYAFSAVLWTVGPVLVASLPLFTDRGVFALVAGDSLLTGISWATSGKEISTFNESAA